MNKKLLLTALGVLVGLTLVATATYAWFSATVNQENVKDQVVSTGTLELTYTDGTEIKLVNARPGATATKTITVKNTGTLETSYNLVWQVLKNEITNDEMVMSATCERLKANGDVEENCEGLDETPITKNMVLKGVDIPSGYSHRYTITVTFKELSKDQNYNQGKNFTGVLGVDEYKDTSPQPVYCTYDGELTQGAEFVKAPYTYRYMQEQNYDSNHNIVWTNINTDGWGVMLTDKESTAPVTEAPCTYINDKPVVSMSFMFSRSKAKSLDVSNFDTSNVTDMSNMFQESAATEIKGLENFNTSKISSMDYMFYESQASSLDLSSFDTSNVTTMNCMFWRTKATEIKGLENFDTSKVTEMNNMFAQSEFKEIDISNFDTSNVTDMQFMFTGMKVISLDLSSFDTSKVTNMFGMFSGMENLETIYVSTKFDVSNVTESSNMFSVDTKLKGGNGTTYNDSYRDKTYARIDTASTPGYFTRKTN